MAKWLYKLKQTRLKLGLIGFVFPEPEGVVHFHNPLLKQSLRSFAIRLRRTRLGLFCIKRS